MSNYGESYYLEELEEMQKEKVVTINPEKQVIIDKSDLDLIYKQISDLEAKLAEKEKELAEYADINNTLNSGLQEKCILCEEEHNQDKISFAVEQLEKVKNGLMRYAGAICNEDASIKSYSYVIRDEDFEKHIDNQIKRLTHQHEDKGE